MQPFREAIIYAKHDTSHTCIWVTIVGQYDWSKDYMWKFDRDEARTE